MSWATVHINADTGHRVNVMDGGGGASLMLNQTYGQCYGSTFNVNADIGSFVLYRPLISMLNHCEDGPHMSSGE